MYGNTLQAGDQTMGAATDVSNSGGSILKAMGLGSVNPYIAGFSVLSDISKRKQEQEAQRKQNQMGALESYLQIAKQMGQGLHQGSIK